MLKIKGCVVKQHGIKECGSACLLSIIRYYKGNISKEELSYLIKESVEGTNAYNLIEGAKKIGFDGYGVRESFDEFIKSNKTFPVIVHVKIKNLYHYIVVYKINKNKKYLLGMDPAKGMVKLKYNNFKDIFNNIVLILYPIKKIPMFSEKKVLFNLIVNTILSTKIRYVLFLSILIIIFTIINNFYFKIIIDYIIVYKSVKYLLYVSFLFFFLSFIKNIINYIKENLLLKINYKLSSTINNYTVNHILRLPYHYFKIKPTGDVISRINDLEDIKELVSKVLINIILNIFLIIISLVVLIFISKELFYITLLFTILYIIIGLIYNKIFKSKITSVQESDADYSSYLTENIENFESIKNLNIINKISRILENKYFVFLERYTNFFKSFNKQNLFKNIIDDMCFIFILSIGVLLIFKGYITIGSLITFSSLVSFYLEPLKSIIDYMPNITFAFSSYDRINELLKYKEENSVFTKKKINGSISVNNLNYSYDNVSKVIKDKSFFIKKSSFVLIRGVSGKGKSTFIKLLKKYISDYEGKITIGEIDLKDIKKEVLDNSITYVSQKEELFSSTIKDNINVVKRVNDSVYMNILNITKTSEIIDKKYLRDNFNIEEGGFNLSGGEKQRIILARALVKDFNYLVLDEALSEVDTKTEIEILNNLKNYYKDKTIIYISHNEKIASLFKNIIEF